MNYFLDLISVVATLLAVLLLFNTSEVQVSTMTPPAIVMLSITGIGMCALGRIIGLLKTILRNTARNQITAQF
jgi:hypothetical protein